MMFCKTRPHDMALVLAALGDAPAWRLTPWARCIQTLPERFVAWMHAPVLQVVHPSGIVLRIDDGLGSWKVLLPTGKGPALIASVKRTRTPLRLHMSLHNSDLARSTYKTQKPLGLQAFLQDLDLAYGPAPRARLDNVVHRIRVHCVQAGIRKSFPTAALFPYGMVAAPPDHFMLDGVAHAMPGFLTRALIDCRDILQVAPDGHSLQPLHQTEIVLPETEHARMEFLHAAQEAGF